MPLPNLRIFPKPLPPLPSNPPKRLPPAPKSLPMPPSRPPLDERLSAIRCSILICFLLCSLSSFGNGSLRFRLFISPDSGRSIKPAARFTGDNTEATSLMASTVGSTPCGELFKPLAIAVPIVCVILPKAVPLCWPDPIKRPFESRWRSVPNSRAILSCESMTIGSF